MKNKITKITPFSVAADGIARVNIETKAGNTLQVFYNPANSLFVVDIIAADESGGNEIVRMKLNEKKLLGHTEQ